MAQTWTSFKTNVKTLMTEDGNRQGMTSWIDRMIRAACLDVQRHIRFYSQGHISVFDVDDFVEDSEASIGELPSDISQIIQGEMISTGSGCISQPLYDYNWDNRRDMICGNMTSCQFALAIDPRGKNFLIYPKVTDGKQIKLEWDGLKASYSDSDTVPFDELMELVVADYVQAHVERKIHGDLAAYESYMGSYRRGKWKLDIEANKKAQMKDVASSPQQGGTCPPAENNNLIEFSVIADFGLDGTGESEVAALVKSFDSDFVIWAGDCNYPAGATDTLDANIHKHWAGYLPDFIYPAWGDIDLTTAESGQYGKPLLNLFPAIALLNSNKLYYQFTKGEVEFFVINTGYSDGTPQEPDGIIQDSTQEDWLDAALDASTATWKIVVGHRPPYTSEDTYTPGITALRWTSLAKADLIISGHAHTYERILVAGLTYLTVGLGGHSKGVMTTPVAGSQFRYATEFGALRVTADATRLQSVFYDKDKNVIDNFTLEQ